MKKFRREEGSEEDGEKRDLMRAFVTGRGKLPFYPVMNKQSCVVVEGQTFVTQSPLASGGSADAAMMILTRRFDTSVLSYVRTSATDVSSVTVPDGSGAVISLEPLWCFRSKAIGQPPLTTTASQFMILAEHTRIECSSTSLQSAQLSGVVTAGVVPVVDFLSAVDVYSQRVVNKSDLILNAPVRIGIDMVGAVPQGIVPVPPQVSFTNNSFFVLPVMHFSSTPPGVSWIQAASQLFYSGTSPPAPAVVINATAGSPAQGGVVVQQLPLFDLSTSAPVVTVSGEWGAGGSGAVSMQITTLLLVYNGSFTLVPYTTQLTLGGDDTRTVFLPGALADGTYICTLFELAGNHIGATYYATVSISFAYDALQNERNFAIISGLSPQQNFTVSRQWMSQMYPQQDLGAFSPPGTMTSDMSFWLRLQSMEDRGTIKRVYRGDDYAQLVESL